MDVNIETSINYAISRLGFTAGDLHDEQKRALFGYLRKKDVFVGLPTGFGKSLIFQAAPLAVHCLTNNINTDVTESETRPNVRPSPEPSDVTKDGSPSDTDSVTTSVHSRINPIIIIISPLTSLIKDQISSLNGKGLKAIYFGDVSTSSETEKNALESGDYNYIFMSPEQLLSHNGICLIKRPVYHRHLCGIFVDESHCIAKWGVGSTKVKAFRSYYGKLSQVRSYLPGNVPVMALTATASLSVRRLIEDKLNLRNPVTVLRSPEKVNLRYSHLKTDPGLDLQFLFEGITLDLAQKERNADRVIVFCRSHRHCREMYSSMTYDNPSLKKYVAMFHSTTEESVKQQVIESFADEKGIIRILIATIAFGMGIDVKGVYNIVHIGPPSDLDDYLQESGRAGRDGRQSHALLINYSGSSGRFQTAEIMKEYIKYDILCRRKLILQPFGYVPEEDPDRPLHLCCDVCAARCLCGEVKCGHSNQGRGTLEEMLRQKVSVAKETQSKNIVRSITAESRECLYQELMEFRAGQLQSHTAAQDKLLTGDDIASGFPLNTVDNIMENVVFISDVEHLIEHFIFLNPQHAGHVMEVISRYTTTLDTEAAATTSDTTQLSTTSDNESVESEDSLSNYRRLRLSSDSSDD